LSNKPPNQVSCTKALLHPSRRITLDRAANQQRGIFLVIGVAKRRQ
jgi:hypothetical protein